MEGGDNRTSATRPVGNPDALLAANVDVIDTSERRSSPFASPTGALRTVQEGTQVRVVSPTTNREEEYEVPRAHAEGPPPSPRRRGTPTSSRRQSHRVTYEDLISRPRSNPRSRTPMRYESPLEHGAFRREQNDNDAPEEERVQARTITIRPSAGLGVGVIRAVPERIHFDDGGHRPKPITLKSQKQGPSKRKTRRWNNDNFVNSFRDLSHSSSSKSRAAAEILAQAKRDASHFLPVYDPADTQRSAQVTSFMEDAKYSDARDKFFRGELHASVSNRPSGKPEQNLDTLKPEDLFLRIDSRLRRVVVKACENSAPACMVVGYFEDYLIKVFGAALDANCDDIDCGFWEELLMEKPTISYKNWNNQQTREVTFLFDGDSSTGGFHRLLAHAVSHFHCLKAITSTVDDNSRKARVLSVHGVMRGGKYRLLDHLESLQEAKQRQ